MIRQAKKKNDTRRSLVLKTAKLLLGAVSAFGLLIGIVTGVLSLLPQVSVSSSAPLNPLDPFSAPFIVNNAGLLSIHDLKYFCRLNNVVYEGAIIKKYRNQDNRAPNKYKTSGTRFCFLCYFARNYSPERRATTKCRHIHKDEV